MAASTIVLSVIPTIGSILAEAVKHSITNQRVDRMAHMLKIVDYQVSSLQRDFLELRMQTDEFRDLLEDALWQTTKALTEERRAYIASLLKNSITSDELSHEQEKSLLSLLGELNDSELIILGWYGTDMVGPEADEYFFRHEAVLQFLTTETGMSDEELTNATLREAYRDHLRPRTDAYEQPRYRRSHNPLREAVASGNRFLRAGAFRLIF
jgi:hypothetical protein